MKIGLLHAAAYVNCRPKLKRQVADLLAHFPAVRASISRYARFAPAASALVDEVVSVDRLTAKGRAIYADLVHRNFSKTK
jgi:O-antigen chain-terminating methyltransferase